MSQQYQQAKRSLELVLHQAEKACQHTGQRIQKATEFIANEQQQAQQLEVYKLEYTQKIQQQQQCNISQISRYRSFCQQLNQALIQQQQKITIAESQLDELRQQFIKQQHAVSVINDLVQQKSQQIQQYDDQQLQKTLDELSARQYSTRASNPS